MRRKGRRFGVNSNHTIRRCCKGGSCNALCNPLLGVTYKSCKVQIRNQYIKSYQKYSKVYVLDFPSVCQEPLKDIPLREISLKNISQMNRYLPRYAYMKELKHVLRSKINPPL